MLSQRRDRNAHPGRVQLMHVQALVRLGGDDLGFSRFRVFRVEGRKHFSTFTKGCRVGGGAGGVKYFLLLQVTIRTNFCWAQGLPGPQSKYNNGPQPPKDTTKTLNPKH